MEAIDSSGEVVHIFSLKECKNEHTVCCQPDGEQDCPICGEKLEL